MASPDARTDTAALAGMYLQEQARRHVKHFVPWASPLLHAPDQFPEMLEAFERALVAPQRVCFSAPPQSGKDLADDTPILTRRRGWVAVGEVVVGDELVASDGSWTKVLQVFPQGEVQLYKVMFTSGKSGRPQVGLETGAGHLWQVSQNRRQPVVKSTLQLLQDGLRHPIDDRSVCRVPVVAPLAGRVPDSLPVDPYLLGLWLGDGSKSSGGFATEDDEVIAAFRSCYPVTDQAQADR